MGPVTGVALTHHTRSAKASIKEATADAGDVSTPHEQPPSAPSVSPGYHLPMDDANMVDTARVVGRLYGSDAWHVHYPKERG
jgi:hypothetical protein